MREHRTIAVATTLLALSCARDATNTTVVTLPVASVSAAPLSSAEPMPTATKSAPHTIAWETDEAAGRREADRRHIATVVSFDAAWCTACRELERRTFSDRAVRLAMKGVVAIRVDANDDEDPKASALLRKYGVVGLPTIVFIDSSGREVTRLVEFADPAAFLAKLLEATSR